MPDRSTTVSATPPSGVAASAHELRKEYGAGPQPVVALAGVDLDRVAGRFTAVMGR